MLSFGTVIQEAPTNPTPAPSRTTLNRFADVAAYISGDMPAMLVGQSYRLSGTTTEVIALMHDGGQVALYDPADDTLTWASRRDAGHEAIHLGPAEPTVLDRASLATAIALTFDIALDQHVVATATSLVDILGLDEAHEYLHALMDFEFATDEKEPWSFDTILADARLWRDEQADEADEAMQTEPVTQEFPPIA